MKRIIIVLALCSPGWGQMLQMVTNNVNIVSGAATPVFAENCVSVGKTGTNAISSGGSYVVTLPNQTGSANLVAGAISYSSGSGATVTVADDKGGGSNTYTVRTVSSASSSRVMQMFYAANVGAAAKLTITFTGGAPTGVQGAACEFYNVATSTPLDTDATTATTTTTTPLAGSITPSIANDLLFACYARAGTPANFAATPYTIASQSNITWKFLTTDAADGMVCEYGVQTVAATINPTITWASTSTYVAGVMAFKSATAGAAPAAGKRIVCIQDTEIPTSQSSTTPLLLQFGCPGVNMYGLAALTGSGGAGAYQLNSITDGNSNTWTNIIKERHAAASAGGSELWYAKNATSSSSETVSVATTGTSTVDATLQFVGMRGMSATPLAGAFQGNGHQTAAANLVITSEAKGGTTPFQNVNIYPASDDWIELAAGGVGSNTMNGTTTSGCFYSGATYTGQSVSGPSTPYENNIWLTCSGTSTAGFTNTMTESDGATAAGDWGSAQAFFRSSTGSTRPTVVKTAMNRVTGTGTTVTLAYTPSATGNALTVFCGRASTAGTVALTDTAGNTITTPDANTTCGSNRMSIHFIASQVAGANTFTCTYSTSVNSQRVIWALESSGVTAVDGTLHGISNPTGDGSGNFASPSRSPSTATGLIMASTFPAGSDLPAAATVMGNDDGNGDITGWKPTFGSATTLGFIDSSTSASECIADVVLKP